MQARLSQGESDLQDYAVSHVMIMLYTCKFSCTLWLINCCILVLGIQYRSTSLIIIYHCSTIYCQGFSTLVLVIQWVLEKAWVYIFHREDVLYMSSGVALCEFIITRVALLKCMHMQIISVHPPCIRNVTQPKHM